MESWSIIAHIIMVTYNYTILISITI